MNRGLWNFDEVRLDYYREANGAFEAFKRGLYDFRDRARAAALARGLRFPGGAQRRRGCARTIKPGMPQPSEISGVQHAAAGVRGYSRAAGADAAVRFPVDQPQLLFRRFMARSAGFFAGSELSAYTRPADARESAPAGARSGQRPARHSWTAAYRLPVTDGSGRDRATLRAALDCCRRPGYDLAGATSLRADKRRGRPSPSKSWSPRAIRSGSRWPISRDLKRAGIDMPTCARWTRCSYDQRRLTLRLRHDPEPLGSVAVARQRAGVLLGQLRPPTIQAPAITWARKSPPSTP